MTMISQTQRRFRLSLLHKNNAIPLGGVIRIFRRYYEPDAPPFQWIRKHLTVLLWRCTLLKAFDELYLYFIL